ncbi:MAG: hypothetical protein NT062_34910 [Proteobacteria bacterium]|nr:hypothetical protein [Pseudomonadota bacterium]
MTRADASDARIFQLAPMLPVMKGMFAQATSEPISKLSPREDDEEILELELEAADLEFQLEVDDDPAELTAAELAFFRDGDEGTFDYEVELCYLEL